MRETNYDKAHHGNLFEPLIENMLKFSAVNEIAGQNLSPKNTAL